MLLAPTNQQRCDPQHMQALATMIVNKLRGGLQLAAIKAHQGPNPVGL